MTFEKSNDIIDYTFDYTRNDDVQKPPFYAVSEK